MFKVYKKELNWGGRPLILETGRIARQAEGAVMVTYGETVVLCAVTAAREAPNVDFFPLTVHYQEKMYAAGRIPGGFFKREGKATEKETLTSRLIDRPIRPLFADEFRNEVQIVCTTMSHDLENNPDIPALIGASAALAIAGLPFQGPLGAARVAFKDGDYILNPTYEQMTETDLDLIVAGTKDAVMMVESEAKELSEEEMLGAVMFGHKEFQPVIDAIIELAAEAGKTPWEAPQPDPAKQAFYEKLQSGYEQEVRHAYALQDKTERRTRLAEIKTSAADVLLTEEDNDEKAFGAAFKKLESDIVRGDILKTGKRIDGRDTRTVRPIDCEVGILPRVHGSALFTRGETQAMVVTTLGTGQDEQIIDATEGESREHFMLHYNFPNYSVGEVGRMGPPGRREIGHGKLAWRALKRLMPTKEEFPYTIRMVSEITESNGSSSMATVCGSSLAMMDAGIPLKRPVAGIAMGLIKEGDDFSVLSDILGDEDHLGDMDFKVAGTDEGVTSLQMDIKVAGITQEIMDVALSQAKDARLHILGEMNKALGETRDGLRDSAPRMETVSVPKDRIGEIIGPGGKMIREITEESGAQIDIGEDGTVTIAAVNKDSIDIARKRIEGIVAEPEIGVIYQGKVVKIMDFGAFVNFMGAKDGLVHISELSTERVKSVDSVVNTGDSVYVKLIGLDGRGKVKLSMKCVNQETGEEIVQAEESQQ
ncbi:MAG: polyribonucleotide nucleotidyltransferase [Alphaproteobacteria bacterium]